MSGALRPNTPNIKMIKYTGILLKGSFVSKHLFTPHSSEMAKRMQAHDWDSTPLGSPDGWPETLKTLVRIMLASGQPMFTTWGPDRILLYNDPYIQMLSERHPSALGSPFNEVWAEVMPDLEPLFQQVYEGYPVFMDDLTLFLNREGFPRESHFAFSYTPIRPMVGEEILGLFCACTETTNSVMARKKVDMERERLFRMSSDLFAVGTFDGYLLSVNPAWSVSLERTDEELLAIPFLDIIHPEDLEKVEIAVEIMRSGEPHQFHTRLLKSDGTSRNFAWSSIPDTDSSSSIFYTVGRDITDEVQREEMFRQAQKMEAVGQLTGGVAHDFNNLLTVIQGSVDLLRRADLPEARRVKYIDAIANTSKRAAKLTSQLLAFARRQALKPAVFEVGQNVRAVTDMIQSLMGGKINVTTLFSDLPCYVNADPSQFDTAIVNMAINARDAMDHEGALTITVKEVDSLPAVRENAAIASSYISVSLEDNGCGIPADQINKIFEPFFTTKDTGKGTGLGLSQVFGFSRQSGGEIQVESEVGVGSKFTLFLPSVEEPAEFKTEGEVIELVKGHGTRVLLVEDNADVGNFATQALNELGYETVWSATADEALEELAECEDCFDIVFSDVVMPGMNGVELGHEIRRLYKNLPVVLTSGYSHVLAKNGTYGFELLHKPYSIEQLSQILSKALAWKKANS